MDETNLVKRVRKERFPGHIKWGRPKKSWDEVVKEDMKKRGLCINDAQYKNKWQAMLQKSGQPRLTGKKRSCRQGKTEKKLNVRQESCKYQLLEPFGLPRRGNVYNYGANALIIGPSASYS